jgi:hypothetical protein
MTVCILVVRDSHEVYLIYFIGHRRGIRKVLPEMIQGEAPFVSVAKRADMGFNAAPARAGEGRGAGVKAPRGFRTEFRERSSKSFGLRLLYTKSITQLITWPGKECFISEEESLVWGR